MSREKIRIGNRLPVERLPHSKRSKSIIDRINGPSFNREIRHGQLVTNDDLLEPVCVGWKAGSDGSYCTYCVICRNNADD